MVGQIAKATTEQSRGIQLIMTATERIRDVSTHMHTATREQSQSSKHISQTTEVISEKSQKISRAINEQKIGSNQILTAIEKIKEIQLQRDNELVHFTHGTTKICRHQPKQFLVPGLA